MFYPPADSVRYIAESKRQDQVERQRTTRLLSDAGIDHRGVLTRSSARVLYAFGHLLVRLGRHLETYELANVTTVQPMQRPAIQAPSD